MNSSSLNDIILKLRCYEPPSVVLPMTGDDLTKHLLITGSTGSGKTSILNEVVHQLISYRASDPSQKIGLLILDAKGDDTPERILQFARESGRQDDVKILRADTAYFYDLFGCLKHLEQIDEYAERVLFASAEMGKDNTFWTEYRAALVRLALTLLVVRHDRISYTTALDLMNQLFFGRSLPEEANFLSQFLDVNDKHLTPFALSRLKQTQQQLKSWEDMDSRTKANAQATLTNLLQPFTSGAAEHFFGTKAHSFDPVAAIQHGHILVASVSSLNHPTLAPLLLRLLRSEFFAAMQGRQVKHHSDARLAGLICDEYPLIVSRDDVVQLQTIRSRRGFVIAATQGFQSIDMAVGAGTRDALLLNFNSHLFLRSHELALEQFAEQTLGEIRVPVSARDIAEERVIIAPQDEHGAYLIKPVCPPGTLPHLPPFHGFASLASGQRTSGAVWFATRFFDSPSQEPLSHPSPSTDLSQLRNNMKDREAETEALAEFREFMKIETVKRMLAHRHQPCFSPEALDYLLELYASRLDPEKELEELVSTFQRRTPRVPRGLETLPVSWRRTIRHFLEKKLIRNPFIGAGLSYCGCHEGVLILTWNEENENSITNASARERNSKLRVTLQMAMYPNIFRRPKAGHLKQLIARDQSLGAWFTSATRTSRFKTRFAAQKPR